MKEDNKKEDNKWMKFAVGEGLTKTVSSLFQKLVGKIMGTLAMGCIASIIIGAIQALSGFLGFVKRHQKDMNETLVPDLKSVSWAILFGFMASIFGTIWSIYTFTLGADIGIRTLLISMSIIPGAFWDRIFWKEKMKLTQICGIGVFLVSAWAMLDYPNLALLLALPVWVPAVLVITFTQSINEALSRASSVKLNIWSNNFWVGLATVFFSIAALVILSLGSGGATLDLSKTFLLGVMAMGAIVIVMIAFKLLAYIGGGTIALKKLVMQGTYLITSLTAGILVYNEPFTSGKVIGVLLFFIAFIMTDNKTRNTLKKLFS